MNPIAKFSDIWVPGGRKLNFDPKALAETTHAMSDEQYYVLKDIVGDNLNRRSRDFAEVCEQYQTHINEQTAAAAEKVAADQRDAFRAAVKEVLSEMMGGEKQ